MESHLKLSYLNVLEASLREFEQNGNCDMQLGTNSTSYSISSTIETNQICTEKLIKSKYVIQTLPRSVCLRKSSIFGSRYSIWSTMEISKDVRFGPYEGRIIYDPNETHQNGYCWQILKNKQLDYSVDGENRFQANWLRYVNFEPFGGQQNLIALQCDGQIYYQTIKIIPPNTELLVWYAEEYITEFGTEPDNDGKKNNFFNNFVSFKEKKPKDKIQHERENFHNVSSEIPKIVIKISKNAHTKELRTVCTTVNTDASKCIQQRTKHKQLTCNICDKRFKKRLKLKKHLKRHKKHLHKGKKRYVCNICKNGFVSEQEPKSNLHAHTRDKSHVNSIRNKNFSNASKLEKHWCERTKPCSSNLYEKTFINNTAKKCQKTHTQEKSHICKFCQKKFRDKRDLNKHEFIHTEQKPHVCELCGKGFSQKVSLKNHQYIHTGKKLYKCGICKKRFVDSSTLKKHQNIHAKEKPYFCGLCKKGFSQNISLKNHQYIHTGQKLYKCDICEQEFTDGSTLRKHKHTHT